MNPLRWFETPSASRKYADLIQKACSKWANWDPPKSIEVGDFGVLNEKSGQFEKHGNIYTHPETKQLAEPFPPVTTAADKEHVVTSHCKKQQGVGVGASAGLDSQRISMQFKFSKRRGALLVMHEPIMHVIPNEFFEQPDTVKQEIFKKKVIVTEVFTCMGYALYLSDKEDRLINLNLNLDVVAGGSVNADVAWSLDVAAGTFRRGYNKERKYAPLYCIKSVRTPPRRRQRGAPIGDQWTECDTPWYELDSDGEEIDDTYDSNDDSD